jgi:GTP cyclohydrolase II
LLALPVDGLDTQRLGDFAVLCSPHAPKLVVTEQRARSIGIKASTAVALPLSPAAGVSAIFDLAANAGNEGHLQERRRLQVMVPRRQSGSRIEP